jgi:acetyltransferase-like isoleucine patch superfamily enzyme
VIIHPHVVIEEGITVGNSVEIFPGSYIGKKPKGAGATARPFNYKLKGLIGDNCAIGPNAVIYYDVEIGNNTLLGDGAALREQVKVGHHCIISRYVTVNYNTVIGNRTKIMDLTHITGNCIIGDDVFIGMLVSTANDNSLITREYDEDSTKGPIIANNVTVGTGAIIFPGVLVNEGALIGAGSVITKNIAAYDVVMGIPAKVIRNLKTQKEVI